MSDRGCVEFPVLDLERLERFAEQLHRHLPRHIVIGLRGTLGAGKTRLAQAIAAAAAIDPVEVTSPTFTLVQHYQGERPIHHIDAYRLADEDEFLELGGEELLEDDAMVLVEWPERITRLLPPNCLMLDIEIDDQDQSSSESTVAGGMRTIRASSSDERLMAILRQIRQRLAADHGGPQGAESSAQGAEPSSSEPLR